MFAYMVLSVFQITQLHGFLSHLKLKNLEKKKEKEIVVNLK